MTATPSADPGAGRGWSERWSPLGGLVFAVTTFVLFLVASEDTGDTTDDLIAYAEDGEGENIAWVVFALVAIPLFGWFVSGLYARVRRLESETAPALVLIGGTVFAVLFFMTINLWSSPLIDFPGEVDPTAAASAYLVFDDVGWVALGGAGVGFALMALAASVAALRAKVVAPWLGWLAAVLGVLSAATIAFFGIFAWLLWSAIVPIVLLVKRA